MKESLIAKAAAEFPNWVAMRMVGLILLSVIGLYAGGKYVVEHWKKKHSTSENIIPITQAPSYKKRAS